MERAIAHGTQERLIDVSLKESHPVNILDDQGGRQGIFKGSQQYRNNILLRTLTAILDMHNQKRNCYYVGSQADEPHR